MKDKIKITEISKQCYLHKGFDKHGCYNCNCKDLCCKLRKDRYGADFDKESYELVIKNKRIIEPLMNIKIENCFEKTFTGEKDFLGKNSIRSLKGKDGFCIFHKKKSRGCILYDLVMQKKVSRRIIPSICRLFPLSWEKGKLVVYNELKGEVIPVSCNCEDPKNHTKKNLLDTQKKEIKDILRCKSPSRLPR